MELLDVSVTICRWNRKLCKNNDHPWLFHCNNICRSLGRYLKTWPSGLVFKQIPRDLATLNA